MGIEKLLSGNSLAIGSPAKDKQDILKEISSLAAKDPVLSGTTAEEIFKRLEAREKLGSTGFNDGIAIPHCFFEGLKDFVVGLIVSPGGIDFNAIDGKKSTLFFFIIAPEEERNRHIGILSAISRISKDKRTLKSIQKAPSEDALRKILEGSINGTEPAPSKSEFCQLVIYLQREDLFNDILEILSGATDSALSVVESANVGYYLNRLPLFSSFWNEESKGFNRLIFAIIKKGLLNNLVRQIYMLDDKLEKEPGLMLTAQDLICAMGSIDY